MLIITETEQNSISSEFRAHVYLQSVRDYFLKAKLIKELIIISRLLEVFFCIILMINTQFRQTVLSEGTSF